MYNNLVRSDSNLLTSKSKNPRDDEEVFLGYGTGIVNYFILIERLIRLFCMLSVLAIP